jgi:hypothetical protein
VPDTSRGKAGKVWLIPTFEVAIKRRFEVAVSVKFDDASMV